MIDETKYILPEGNYYKDRYSKTQIVIGHTGRGDMRHFGEWKHRRNGKSKRNANFTIDKDGKVYQHFDPKYYSDFIGVEQDKSNITIVLVNEGWLKNVNNLYIDWLGHTYNKSSPIFERAWRGHKFWMDYTEEQLDSVRELVVKLCDDFKIKKKCIGHCVFNEDADIFKGITFRSNYKSEMTDISPAFNLDVLKEL